MRGPRVEGAIAAGPTVREARRDHRVLDAAPAVAPQNAPRVQAGDDRAAKEHAGRRGRPIDAADERGHAGEVRIWRIHPRSKT